VLDALFLRAFVATDWESGIEVAVSNPDLVIVTRDGDRFAASGWRVASGRALVTRSTVDEAHLAATQADTASRPFVRVATRRPSPPSRRASGSTKRRPRTPSRGSTRTDQPRH